MNPTRTLISRVAALCTALLAGCTSAPLSFDGLAQAVAAVSPALAPQTTTTTGSVSTGAVITPPVVSAANPPATPAPGQAPAFENVIKGAQRIEGALPLWKRQDRVWIELSPKALGRPFFLSPTVTSGIGEGGLFGGLLASRWGTVGRPQWVEFRRVQQQVQLLAINAAYTAQKGSAQERAVQAAFSPSLLSSVPVASAPHPDSGAILIEANPLLVVDLLGLGMQLQRVYRQGYVLDLRNSALTVARTRAEGLTFEVQHHFFTSTVSQGTGLPGLPSSVPDPRSLFITVRYNLGGLADPPMKPRLADPRVGYFTTTVADFTTDLARTPRIRYINRWRLEKKDPKAAQSEAVRPLVYLLDPSIPDNYRRAIRDGILEWNKAFEAIGFKNAIQVQMPSADRTWEDIEDGSRASIRWLTNSQPAFGAIGPTHVDPRTGEILQAHIGLESLSTRAVRAVRSQILPGSATDAEAEVGDACEHAQWAGEQLDTGLESLASHGVIDPTSPEVEAFVLAYLKDTTMHEVGHTLGLRHNFRASRWRTAEQLANPVLTQKEGLSASVMDYLPINLPAPGKPAPAAFQSTLGPYDYWAIEYGYAVLPQDEKAGLQRIAQRSAQPAWAFALDYGTDEDLAAGVDPYSLTFDLGRDPIAYARQRLLTVRDLLAQLASQDHTPSDDPALLRRRVSFVMRDSERTAFTLMRQIGGVVTRRDAASSRRDLLDPLPFTEQRRALDLLAKEFLSVEAIAVPPRLQRRLAPDYFERQEGNTEVSSGRTDFSVADNLLSIQRDVLEFLMAEGLSERLLDNIDKTRDRKEAPLTVGELHTRLKTAIWGSPLAPPAGENASWRRNLQREHVNRLSALVVRATSQRADVRSAVRQSARMLLSELRGRRWGAAMSAAEAHRNDCIETLQRALDANVVRTGP